MNRVPHCEKCDNYFKDSLDSFSKERHYCKHDKVKPRGCSGHMMLAKESKTSPLWCPKRKESNNE